jgi:hypothetical protein
MAKERSPYFAPTIAWRKYGYEVLVEDCRKRVYYALGGLSAYVWNHLAAGESPSNIAARLGRTSSSGKGSGGVAETLVLQIIDCLREFDIVVVDTNEQRRRRR